MNRQKRRFGGELKKGRSTEWNSKVNGVLQDEVKGMGSGRLQSCACLS